MLATSHPFLGVDAFLAWAGRQSERYELVRGQPLRMMTGAKQSHNVVVGNMADALRRGAKARGCRTTTSDTAVATGAHGVRYPDIVVDCGPPDPNALVAAQPTIICEVLSPSTSQIDLTDKLDEYRALDAVQFIVLVDPDVVSVKLYRRGEDGTWVAERYDELGDVVEFTIIGTSVSVAEIYDTLDPKTRARLEVV